MERRALAGLGLGTDAAAVAGEHAAHAGQADAGARVVAGLVQPLEHAEQLAGVLHVETGAIVAHGELAFTTGQLLHRHLDDRAFATGGVFHRVAEQVQPKLPHHVLVGHQHRQRRDLPFDLAHRAIAGPILGEFLLGYTVVIVGLWLASHTSDGAAGSLGLANQVLETLFVLYRVLAIGMGVVITQLLGGQQTESVRRTALAGLGTASWAGMFVFGWLVLGNDLILDVLNAPAEILPMAAPYLQLLAPAALLEGYNLMMAASTLLRG